MELHKIQKTSDYLEHFKKSVTNSFWKEYVKLAKYYQELCEEFLKIANDTEKHFISCMRNILLVDAKIQMLFQFIVYIENNPIGFELSEDEIIEIIEISKSCYYRELLGGSLYNESPWMIICISDQPYESKR